MTAQKTVLRCLVYRGVPKWVDGTLDRSMKGGVVIGIQGSIQERRIGGWLAKVLIWWISRAPKARPVGEGLFKEVDQR